MTSDSPAHYPPGPRRPVPRGWRGIALVLLTVAIATAGGLAMQLLPLPAALIMGSALAVSVAGLAGVPIIMPGWLRDSTFVVTGAAMGASVARDSLSLMAQWPVTLIALAIELVLIILVTGWMLQKVFRIDRGTAYMSSFPGHLSFVLGIASAGVGNARQIAIIQVIRILLLTICVPIGATFLPIEHFADAVRAQPMGWDTLAALIVACAVGGFFFTRLRVPAGYVLGAMFVATTAKLGGLYDGSMPHLPQDIGFILIGAIIGSRIGDATLREVRDAALGGVIATILTVSIVTAIALLASRLVEIPFGQIWLGLSPGALEGMGALGLALGYDPAFIAAHHVARLLMLTIAIPTVVVLVRRGGIVDSRSNP